MPLYEYECQSCGARFEKIQKFSDPPVDTCQQCGNGPVTKLVSSPAIQFKGSGWYITDYARKDSGKSSGSSDNSSGTSTSTTGSSSESTTSTSTTPAKTDTSTPKSDT